SGTLHFAPAGGQVPVGETPQLNIAQIGAQVMISWTSSWSGFELQSKDELSGGQWLPVGVSPAVVGEEYTGTLDAAGGSQFYRLAAGLGVGAGETTKTVVVQVIGDTLNEADETFLLKLSNAGNAVIACAQAVGTIVNDDPVPTLCVEDVRVVEGNSGTTNA